MIYYFKISRWVYRIGIALSGLLALLSALQKPAAPVPDEAVLPLQISFLLASLIFIFPLCWLFSLFLAQRIAIRQERRLLRPLMEDCDPQAFLNGYRPFFFHNRVQAEKPFNQAIYLSLGYGDAGQDFFSSQVLLEAIRPEKRTMDTYCNGVICVKLANEFLKLGDRQKALAYLEQARLTLGRLQDKDKLAQSLREHLDLACHSQFHQESGISIDDCVRFWERRFTEPKLPRREKVLCQWSLVRLYQEAGALQKAKECCEYVIKHGNQLICVKQAQRLLTELEQPAA